MKKAFRLPKEFADKWLAALRSGEYTQGETFLMFTLSPEDVDDINVTKEQCYYCCLGVAGKVGGADEADLSGVEVLYPGFFEKIVPMELIGQAEANPLIAVLTALNDGCTRSSYNSCLKNENYIFRDLDIHQNFSEEETSYVKFDFNQIADFIEDNCEFYDEVN